MASLCARLLFLRATPDANAGWSQLFKGDAPLWLDYAEALWTHQPFELGLPFHPPGTAYLISYLWSAGFSGYGPVRFAWALMGAASVVVFSTTIQSAFGKAIARLAGTLMAFSTGLLLLSLSPDSETPYLLFVAATLALMERLRKRLTLGRLILFSALQGIACLFRVEHLSFYVGSLALLGWFWSRNEDRLISRRALARALAVSLFAFAGVLVPWHVHAFRAVTRFNTEEPRLEPAEEAAVARLETPLTGLAWERDARARRDRLPAFTRRVCADFVAATVAFRGRQVVRAADFDLLRDAFDYEPEPLTRVPFVSLYGPLNFALGNFAGARGGFDRTLLQEPPRAAAEPFRYPTELLQGLPPPQLSFVYPPHLRLVNHGYRVGAQWIASEPLGFLRLVGRKLARFWSGAALGSTSFGLPLGLSGTRAAVDLVVPEGGSMPTVFRLAVLGLCVTGLIVIRPWAPLSAWLLFLGSRILPTILFFGYARVGATAIPVVAVLISGAVVRLASSARLSVRRPELVIAGALVFGVAVEGVRAVREIRLTVDGQSVVGIDRVEPDLYKDQSVDVQ